MASTSSPALINTSQSITDPNQQPYPHPTALLNLIKKLARYKPLSDHQSSIISLGNSTDFKNKAPTENLILDGFLKNNGGYLDDSDSSDSEDSEEQPPSETNQNKHTIRVLAKKYQNEADSSHNPLIGFTLSKKIFKFNLNQSDHHHQHISTIINKQSDDQNIPKTNLVGDFLGTTGLDNDHHPNDHTADSNQPSNRQQCQPDQMENSPPIQFIRSRKDQLESSPPIQFVRNRPDQLEDSTSIRFIRSRNNLNCAQKLNKIDPSSNNQRKHCHHQRGKDEDWDLNLRYIQSSTFPTKNTIIDHDHSRHDNRRHPSLGYSCADHNQSFVVTANNSLYHKKSKSPFRNLVLGQDDLLRSN